MTWSPQKTPEAALPAGCCVRERTRDPPRALAVAMAITWSNKGIAARKSHRGSIPAVRSLFILVRFCLRSAFGGIPEIDLRLR